MSVSGMPEFIWQKEVVKICREPKYYFTLHPENNGSLAEWLGNGLQNRVRRFESARNLIKSNLALFRDFYPAWVKVFFFV